MSEAPFLDYKQFKLFDGQGSTGSQWHAGASTGGLKALGMHARIKLSGIRPPESG